MLPSFLLFMDSANQQIAPLALVVMGVSGCGKSSVAQQLANSLGWGLHEGDAYHSEANIAKMRAGVPLNDEDRADWLARLARLLSDAAHAVPPQSVVLTCSALKRKYRDQLRAGLAPGQVGFLFLDLDFDTALQRVQQRPGHFFSPELVANQFTTLERPDGEPGVLGVDATLPLAEIVGRTVAWVQGAAPSSSFQP
jgi:gluconokinase